MIYQYQPLIHDDAKSTAIDGLFLLETVSIPLFAQQGFFGLLKKTLGHIGKPSNVLNGSKVTDILATKPFFEHSKHPILVNSQRFAINQALSRVQSFPSPTQSLVTLHNYNHKYAFDEAKKCEDSCSVKSENLESEISADAEPSKEESPKNVLEISHNITRGRRANCKAKKSLNSLKISPHFGRKIRQTD